MILLLQLLQEFTFERLKGVEEATDDEGFEELLGLWVCWLITFGYKDGHQGLKSVEVHENRLLSRIYSIGFLQVLQGLRLVHTDLDYILAAWIACIVEEGGHLRRKLSLSHPGVHSLLP